MGWFSYNGQRTDTLGLLVEQMPSPPRATRRVTKYTVAGRDGSLAVSDNCFEDLAFTAVINMNDAQTRAFIGAWLAYSGDLILSDDPTKCLHVRIETELTYSRHRAANGGNYDSVTVQFISEPFWYEASPTTQTYSGNQTITNPGTAKSYPLIKLYGSGAGSMTVNGAEFAFTGLGAAAFIVDSLAGKAYLESAGTGTATMVADEFPVFGTGDNTITVSGITSYTVTPRWRWL